MLKSNPYANVSGSSLVGYFRASYQELYDLFGKPSSGDEYKVSTKWIIEHFEDVFTLYDWKQTDLYDDCNNMTVEEFRDSNEPHLWHIGGFKDPECFIFALHYELKRNRGAK